MQVATDVSKLGKIRRRFSRFSPVAEEFPDDLFSDGLPVFQETYRNYDHLLKIAQRAENLVRALSEHDGNCATSISPELEQLMDALEEE